MGGIALKSQTVALWHNNIMHLLVWTHLRVPLSPRHTPQARLALLSLRPVDNEPEPIILSQ